MLDAIVEEDPDWLAVQFEATRRMRTDADFRRVLEEREEELVATRDERLAVSARRCATTFRWTSWRPSSRSSPTDWRCRLSMDDPLPDLDALAKLVDEGVAPR